MFMGIYDREEAVERSRRWARIGSVILIASGTLSIVMPLIAGLSISLVCGLAFLAAGLAHGILAFRVRERASNWGALVAIASFAVAMTLLAKQNIAVVTMTLAIAASALLESTAEIAYFAIARTRIGSEWALVNATLTILLILLTWWAWPRSATWVLEIVGVHLIASGFTWILRSRASY